MQSRARRIWKQLARVVLLALAFSLPLQHAGADELIMRDGSCLLGKVIKRENDTLDSSVTMLSPLREPRAAPHTGLFDTP